MKPTPRSLPPRIPGITTGLLLLVANCDEVAGPELGAGVSSLLVIIILCKLPKLRPENTTKPVPQTRLQQTA